MKNIRQREILNIIQEQDIDTQEQLLEARSEERRVGKECAA